MSFNQGNMFTGRRDASGDFTALVTEALQHAASAYRGDTDEIKTKQNKFAMARTFALALVGAGCENDELLNAFEELVCGRFPAPDTFARTIRKIRSDDIRPFDIERHYDCPKWKKRRELYLATHRRECGLCPNMNPFQVNLHHRNYLRVGRERDTDLILLCRPCHARQEGVMP